MSEPTKTPDEGPLGGAVFEHPAYGAITLNRVTGRKELFMVDYPQGHFIRLELHTASHRRSLSNDWVHPEEMIATVDLSEVQWARLLCSLGQGAGVPCTLDMYQKPGTGKFLRPGLTHSSLPKGELFADEVREAANDAAKRLDKAIARAADMIKSERPGMTELRKLAEDLRMARQELQSNIPFVMKCAEEQIESAIESAKAEVEAYNAHATQRLGRAALAEQLSTDRPTLQIRKVTK